MIKGRILKCVSGVLGMVWVILLTLIASADEVPSISPDQLKSMLGNPDVVILDVRSEKSWKVSVKKILGAVREDPEDPESWAEKYPKQITLVLYGDGTDETTSARVARKLIEKGFTKVYVLKGGWILWSGVGYPTEFKGPCNRPLVEASWRLKSWWKEIVRALVDSPEEVSVRVTVETTTMLVQIKVFQEDMGELVGKKGKNIDALRTIVKAACKGKECVVDVVEGLHTCLFLPQFVSFGMGWWVLNQLDIVEQNIEELGTRHSDGKGAGRTLSI